MASDQSSDASEAAPKPTKEAPPDDGGAGGGADQMQGQQANDDNAAAAVDHHIEPSQSANEPTDKIDGQQQQQQQQQDQDAKMNTPAVASIVVSRDDDADKNQESSKIDGDHQAADRSSSSADAGPLSVGLAEAASCKTVGSEPGSSENVKHKPHHLKQSDELKKLHNLCTRLIEGQQATAAPTTTAHDEARSQTTDSILQLLVTEDMSSIRSSDVLKSLFVEYLHLLPPKVVSEVLSVLIAIVKKSVFHLESTRGLLIPCIKHLMLSPESTVNKSRPIKAASSGEQSQHQSQDNPSLASSISLTKHFLREWINLLIAHSCDVEELKSIMKLSEHDPTLLNFIQQANLKQRNRPPAFFAFPGTKGSMMSLPPFQKWPIQFGWSFSTWFFLEPKACAQPYLYNFKTGKSGLGYSAHFTGNCLVLTSIRVKGKGVQHCVAYEFPSYKWIHCAITYHNKWRASEIKVYVNGQFSANIEMPWQVQTTEIFDKCFIGGSGSITSNDRSGELNSFCGQMAALYLFNEGLSPAQICALHRLGPSYIGQFKYSNESHVNLPPQICRPLYEEKLASTLFCLFTPVAVDSGTLCIQLAPFKSSTTPPAQNFFISAPHAALLGQTKAITTQPICYTLQSLGCSRSLLPLLDVFANIKSDPEACSSLIGFLCDLLESSPHWFANEIVQNNGFVVVACALASNARVLLSEKLLEIFLNLTKTLLTTSSTLGDSLLLKHLMDNILFNPTLWIYADTKLQIKLYSYLANEFLHGTRHSTNKYTGISNLSSSSPYVAYNPTSSAASALSNQNYSYATGSSSGDDQQQPKSGNFQGLESNAQPSVVTDLLFGEVRRVSTVLQSLHALKYYYWMVEEKGINPKAQNQKLRPNQVELATIRSHLLQFTKELIVRSNGPPLDEIQGLLNYLSSCTNAENLLDVLNMLSSLIREHPTSIVSALDQKQGIKVLFGSLIGSPSERVRIQALKLLGLYLCHCTHKKKQDIMGPSNLFMLLCDRLRVYKPLTIEAYEALIDIMLESEERTADGLGGGTTGGKHDEAGASTIRDVSKGRIENSIVIKVIATLLHEERSQQQQYPTSLPLSNSNNAGLSAGTGAAANTTDIRRLFINDLWNLIVASKENRRIILQMSVWQHWLINLIDSTIVDSQLVRDQVLAIFRVLLYHAIRYEYGGWRVWIDTLAIIHTKVSYDEFCQQLSNTDATPTGGLAHRTSHTSTTFEDSKRGDRAATTRKRSKDTVATSKAVNLEQVAGLGAVGETTAMAAKKEDGTGGGVKKVQENLQSAVSSISERIPRESSGIKMNEDDGVDDDDEDNEGGSTKEDEKGGVDEPDSEVKRVTEQLNDVDLSTERENTNQLTGSSGSPKPESLDSVDLAPSRAYRKISKDNAQSAATGGQQEPGAEGGSHGEITRQHSLTSIPLEDPSSDTQTNIGEDEEDDEEETSNEPEIGGPADDELKHHHRNEESSASSNQSIEPRENHSAQSSSHHQQKATASPAFRIPEFKWGNLLIKLLNDLMFSVECDLYHWRRLANCTNLDTPPFVPKSANQVGNQAPSAQTTGSASKSSSSSSAQTVSMESLLQKAENQIYIINIVHFMSQLADNIIIAAGGLLPLLADATGGSRSSSSSAQPTTGGSADDSSKPTTTTLATCEGLTLAQANSLLYRLVNMVDVVIFAASHINLNELEADKNTTSGGILRQCLRLACTVTVKNCLVVRSLNNKIAAMGIGGQYIITANDFPKEMFDSYQGCSLLSANGLFERSALSLDNSDLIANVEYSPHQTPNTSSMPSMLPFQSVPIRDPNKLLQAIDISRIQACIYHDFSTESRQSQFLALSSLYFISVLMVSKYRDIIEPKQKSSSQKGKGSLPGQASISQASTRSDDSGAPSSGFQNGGSVSSIESNLLTFGKMQPNASTPSSSSSVGGTGGGSSTTSTNTLTDILTTRLENCLDTVCPLLKSIMCDFCAFLSKTLIGSHGQDLVNKEADRTFKRANTSPVELVMLLCSQEWQNTLQKNAGLAFIELINEGRVLSHGMKDHIVRVAMEAEFILSRLRADDVAKHEHFGLACSETQSARLHEEVLINSLISSATRRDYVVYCRFKETIQNQKRRKYKLDIWEDDDRRKRRFVIDSWDDAHQNFYVSPDGSATMSIADKETDKREPASCDQETTEETKRILELQQTIELGGIDDHCSPAGANTRPESENESLQVASLVDKGDDDCEDEEFEEDDDDDHHHRQQQQQNDSNSPDSDNERPAKVTSNSRVAKDGTYTDDSTGAKSSVRQTKAHNFYANSTSGGANKSHKELEASSAHDIGSSSASAAAVANEAKNSQVWDYDDCSSINDFTGSVIFAAECSLIWNIYAIPGVFQLTNHELYFEPNQNISEAIDVLKKEGPTGGSQLEDAVPENGFLNNNKHNSNLQARSNHTAAESLASSNHMGDQIALRKLDLKVLRYCDFLTCNGKISLGDVRAIFSRHYLLQPHALEIFLVQRTSVMFAFSDFDTVKRAVKYLPPVGVGIKYGITQSRRASLMSPRQLFAASNMTQKWQKREIGNFQYLMFLNTIAGRTYQDLNQYPVFPWILTNYDSEELDINSPTNFRDLSKPVGALNSKRRAEFIERYQSWDNPKVPAFHYGTHYSTAAFTLNWLCRLRGASNSAYLALQDGKYEEDSRLFLSIGDSWVSSLIGGQQNVKELIPEFFYLPEMFHSNLGLPEVEYPPWAKSAEQFVRTHRLALESELVSCQLHQWIDLIFGYKQRGPEAINAVNTFYYLTYQGNVNLNMIQDPSLREAIETQIKHFGQTPSQLTTEPHPPRFSALHASPLIFSSTVDEVNKVVKFPFNTSIVHISSCINNYIASTSTTGESSSTGSLPNGNNLSSPCSVLTITSNNQYQIHKWLPNEQSGQPFAIDPQLEQSSGSSSSANRKQLIDVDDLYSGISLKLHNYNGTNINQDTLDEVQWPCAHYVVTLDGRYIIMGSFYDNSFRVFTTEGGKLCQVIYGHRGPITCIGRSDGNPAGDFYVATGSQDCSLLLWTWNDKYAQIEGSGVSAVHNPLPKLTINGHQTPVLSVIICAELGLIISGSKNLILVHTTTSGENLLEIDVLLPNILDKSSFESRAMTLEGNLIQRPQVKDKQRTILEASMLGDGNQEQNLKLSQKAVSDAGGSRSPSLSSSVSERFAHLKDLCRGDYYITQLKLARELAFIVCVALPAPKRKTKAMNEEIGSVRNSAALLMTFNLKGSLMESITIGQSVNSPRLGDVCILQMAHGGEHLVLNDSPTTLKIYRTFDLQPVYAYNTNDIPHTLSEDQNRVKSMVLLDYKHILVGLENGKIIVYNVDFKNLR